MTKVSFVNETKTASYYLAFVQTTGLFPLIDLWHMTLYSCFDTSGLIQEGYWLGDQYNVSNKFQTVHTPCMYTIPSICRRCLIYLKEDNIISNKHRISNWCYIFPIVCDSLRKLLLNGL